MISSIHDGRDHRVVGKHRISHIPISINDTVELTGTRDVAVRNKRKL